MTLVAAWMEQGTPILAGDALITSSSDNPIHRRPIPTRDDLIEILPSSRGVAVEELFQKVYVISPSLCVGFSGSPFSAADVIATLSNRFATSSCSLDQLRPVLTSISDHSHLPCTIIGWLRESDHFSCFRWSSPTYSDFGTAPGYAIGSGQSHFEDIIRARGVLASHDPIESAIASIFNLLKDEVLYGSSLPHRFGGAYKIVAFLNGEFRVVPSVLHVPMQIEETDDPAELAALQPRRVLKTHQNGEIMEVMAVLLTEHSIGSHEREASDIATHRMYYVPTVFVQPGDRFVVNSSLPWRSEFYSIALDIKLRETLGTAGRNIVIVSLSRVFSDEARDRYISIQGEGADLEQFVMKDPLFKEIFKVLSSIDRDALIRQAKTRGYGLS